MVQNIAKIDDTPVVLASPASTATGDATTLKVDSYGALWTVNAQIPVEETVLASAARTALATTSFTNTRYRGVHIIIDITLDPSTASITPRIDGYSTLGDDWYTILQGSAIAAVGQTKLSVYPGAVAAANVTADDWLPPTWRFYMAVADAESMTYSVNAIHLP